ncbi:MAG: hypothetical protein ACJ72N_28100 [Labedaea sp.]
MKSADQRLVAALVLLRDRLSGVVEEVLAGEISQADRSDLARALRRIAENLSPIPVVPGEQTVCRDRAV